MSPSCFSFQKLLFQWSYKDEGRKTILLHIQYRKLNIPIIEIVPPRNCLRLMAGNVWNLCSEYASQYLWGRRIGGELTDKQLKVLFALCTTITTAISECQTCEITPLKRADPSAPSNIHGSDKTDEKQPVALSLLKYIGQSHSYQMISLRLMLFKSAPGN